jgi:CHAT domain-containing protein/tetratricopeptide (TPR) repeat protein
MNSAPVTRANTPPSPDAPPEPGDFALALLARPLTEQAEYLADRLPQFQPPQLDEIAAGLKRQADGYMRTDLSRCLHVAGLLQLMARQTGNPAHRALALRAEGNAYAIGQGNYQQAIVCYDAAAEIYGRLQQIRDQAWSQNGKIYALANLGKYEEALAVGQWAAQVFHELAEWLPLAELTVNLAIMHGRLGQDTTALALLDEARALYRQSGPEGAQQLPVVEMNRAILLRNLGRFHESIETHLALLQTYKSQGKAVDAARARQNLAMTYSILGRYNEALTLLDAAGEAFTGDGRFRHAMLVELFTGDCLLQLRRFPEALEKCQRARQLFSKLGAPFEIGKCLLQEAHALMGLERFADARATLQEARALFTQEGNRPALADTDLTIAQVMLQQRELPAALRLAQGAANIFQQHDLPLGEARAYLLAARIAFSLEHHSEAQSYTAQALAIAQTHQLPTLIYQGQQIQGELAASRNRPDQALAAWLAGIEALEQLYSSLMLEYRVNFAEDKVRLYENVVGLYLEQGEAAKGFHFAERAKSRALRDLLAYRLDLRIEARSPADQPLVEQTLVLRAERDRLYRRWHTGEEAGQRDDPAAQLLAQQRIGQQVIELEQQITAAWHKLLVRNAAYAQDAALWEPPREATPPDLDEETILLEFFSLNGQFLLFLVTRQGVEAVKLPVTTAQLQQLMQRLWLNLRAVPQGQPANQAALARNAQAILQQLYQLLIQPIRTQLGGYRRLLVVPHGPLHYLPVHALYDGAAYLLERFEIGYLPAAGALPYCRHKPQAANGLLALGYSGNGRLPQAPQEASSIAQIWRGATLLEEEATLANLRQQAGGYRLLHLATHGEFRPDNPLFSGLALADGWLTTLDIFNLRLQASLVTLSACQTGRSLVGGGDELLGLMRAFLAAGACSLVATFWPVEDTLTASLMQDFYQALAAGADKGTALRQAQLPYLDRHPYFWAPFFLVGDTGPL